MLLLELLHDERPGNTTPVQREAFGLVPAGGFLGPTKEPVGHVISASWKLHTISCVLAGVHVGRWLLSYVDW